MLQIESEGKKKYKVKGRLVRNRLNSVHDVILGMSAFFWMNLTF